MLHHPWHLQGSPKTLSTASSYSTLGALEKVPARVTGLHWSLQRLPCPHVVLFLVFWGPWSCIFAFTRRQSFPE
jgi:hypothetical protein